MQTNKVYLLLLVFTTIPNALLAYDEYCVCPPIPSFEDNNNLDIFTLGENMDGFMDHVENYVTSLPGMFHDLNQYRGEVPDISKQGLVALGTKRKRSDAVMMNFSKNTFNNALEHMNLSPLSYNRTEMEKVFNVPQNSSHDKEEPSTGQFEHVRFLSFKLKIMMPDIKNYKGDNEFGWRWDQMPEVSGYVRFVVMVRQFRTHNQSGYRLSFHLSNGFINSYEKAFAATHGQDYKTAPVSVAIMDRTFFKSLVGGHQVVISKFHNGFIPATICNNTFIFYSKLVKTFTGYPLSGAIMKRSSGCGGQDAIETNIKQIPKSLGSFYPEHKFKKKENPLDQIDTEVQEDMIQMIIDEYNETDKKIDTFVELPALQYDILFTDDFTYLYILMLIYKYQSVYQGLYLLVKDNFQNGNDINTIYSNVDLSYFDSELIYVRLFDAVRIFMRYFYSESAIQTSILIIEPSKDFDGKEPAWYSYLVDLSHYIYEHEVSVDGTNTLYDFYEDTMEGMLTVLEFVRAKGTFFSVVVEHYKKFYKKDEKSYIIIVTLIHMISEFLFWDHHKGIFWSDLIESRKLWYGVMTSTQLGGLPSDYVYSLEFLNSPIGEAYDNDGNVHDINQVEIQRSKSQAMMVKIKQKKNGRGVSLIPISTEFIRPRKTDADIIVQTQDEITQVDNSMMMIPSGNKKFTINEVVPIYEVTEEYHEEEFDIGLIMDNYDQETLINQKDSLSLKDKNKLTNLQAHTFSMTPLLGLTETNLDGSIVLTVDDDIVVKRTPQLDVQTFDAEVKQAKQIIEKQNKLGNTTITQNNVEVKRSTYSLLPLDVPINSQNTTIIEKVVLQRDTLMEQNLNATILQLNEQKAIDLEREKITQEQLFLIQKSKKDLAIELENKHKEHLKQVEEFNLTQQRLRDEVSEKDNQLKQQLEDVKRQNELRIQKMKEDHLKAIEISQQLTQKKEEEKYLLRETVHKQLEDYTQGRDIIYQEMVSYVRENKSQKKDPKDAVDDFTGHTQNLLYLIFLRKLNSPRSKRSWGDFQFPLDNIILGLIVELEDIPTSDREAWNDMMLRLITLSTILKSNDFKMTFADNDTNELWMNENMIYEYHKSRKVASGELVEPIISDDWQDKVSFTILMARYKIAVALRDFFFNATTTGLDFSQKSKNQMKNREPIFTDFRIRVDSEYRVLYEVQLTERVRDSVLIDRTEEEFILTEILIVMFSVQQDALSEEEVQITLNVDGEIITVNRDMRGMFAHMCKYKPFLEEAQNLAKKERLKREEEELLILQNKQKLTVKRYNGLNDEYNQIENDNSMTIKNNEQILERNIQSVKKYELNETKQKVAIQKEKHKYEILDENRIREYNSNMTNLTRVQSSLVQIDESIHAKFESRVKVIETLEVDVKKSPQVSPGFYHDPNKPGFNRNQFKKETGVYFNFNERLTKPEGIDNVTQTKTYNGLTMHEESILQQQNKQTHNVYFQQTELKKNIELQSRETVKSTLNSRSQELQSKTVVTEGNSQNLSRFSGKVVTETQNMVSQSAFDKIKLQNSEKFKSQMQNVRMTTVEKIDVKSNMKQKDVLQEKNTAMNQVKTKKRYDILFRQII